MTVNRDDVENDQEFLSHVRRPKPPPDDFNPLEASAAELTLYGIPARPDPRTHPLLAAKWQRTMNRDFQMVSPELSVNRDFVRQPIRDHLRAPTSAFDTSSNWSGAYVLRPEAEPFTGVSASWIVPDVAPPPSARTSSGGWTNGTYLMGAWVGIDGWDGSGDVLQAGTASSVTVAGGQIQSKSFSFWYEWFGNAPVYPAGFALQAGDLISCSVCATTPTHGVAAVLNLTTGQAMSYGFDAPSGVSLSGNVAEWIVEDPGNGKGEYPFPNYGATFFRDATAGTKHYEFNLGSATTISLIQGSATLSSAVIESNSVLMCYFGPDGP
jgi:hypothetical protein